MKKADARLRIGKLLAAIRRNRRLQGLAVGVGTLLPPEGPGIFEGKGLTMSSTNQEKALVVTESAANDGDSSANTIEGKVVSMLENKLTTRSREGKELSHLLASDVKLTRNGTVCQRAELKVGRRVRVTTKHDDRNTAIGVDLVAGSAEVADSRNQV